MKLTKEQTTYIENDIKKNDIKYYEVYMEILDHMILSVEELLDENPTLNFEEVVLKAKNDFGFKGFKGLVKQREEFLQKKQPKDYIKAIKTFFSFPKIVFTLISALSFYFFIGLFESPKKVTLLGILFLTIIAFFQLKYWYKTRKIEGYKILKNQIYFYGINSVCLWINFINIIDNDSPNITSFWAKGLFTVFFIMSLFSLLIFIKIRKQTVEELKTQIFV